MNLTPERWQQVASLYEAAVDLDNASRETFLREACAGDDALRREVDSLIRDGASEPFILDAPVWTAAAWLLAAGDELRAGVSLGPYRIEAPLGAGGMGQVFRATDTRLDRQVAIKLLAPHVALDPQLRARFAREARAGAALAHPHICAIYDVGLHGGVEFLVMEYLEGETLAARLSRDRLPTARALAYAIEIAGALDHAHRQGVIHRDLKPANVMVTARGTILLDFGLAKLRPPGRPVTGDVEVTRKGTVLGSTRYMAPEQIEGREADTRTDLFALGAVAYEMLTGRKAFEGESRTKVAAAILEREPLPVSAHLPLATPVLDHVIRRCLAKDPDERWQSAGDVMRELKWAAASVEALRSGQPSVPAAATSAQRLWRRRDVVATVAGLVTGLAVWRATRSTAVVSEDASFKILLPATQRLTAGNYQRVAVSPTGDVVYAAADALWLRRRSALDATVIAGTESTGAHSPSFSPDGEWLAFFSRGHIRRARVLGGPLSLTIAAAAPPSASRGRPTIASSMDRDRMEYGKPWLGRSRARSLP